MQEVLDEALITLGTPVVYLSSLKEGDGVHIPPPFSHVSLLFTSAKLGPVNLYAGSHPYLKISESDLKLAFAFDANADTGDLGRLFENALIAEVEEMLKAAKITIRMGARADGGNLDLHYFKAVQEKPLKGLHFSPKAIAHRKWFE